MRSALRSMIRGDVVACCLAIGMLVHQPIARAQPADTATGMDLTPRTQTFAGDYRIVRIAIEAGWPADASQKSKAPRSCTLIVAFRDGAAVGVWAHGVSSTPAVIHLREHDARLTAGGIKGGLTLFFGQGTTSGEAMPLALTFDLTRAGNDLTGTVAVGDVPAVSVKGTVEDAAQLQSANALAPGKDWPSWQGVDASVRGPTSGVPLVASLSQARPVWRSEAALPVAFGNAADFRYALRAAAQGTCGGASSPVIAGGRLFTYHYQPSGSIDEKAATETLAKAPATLRDFQREWVRDMYRDAADDVVVATDTATGRLLWRTTLPLRTMNLQTHKHRGVNPTLLAAGDVLFVPNYVGRVYCLEAATGKVRWEYPQPPSTPYSGTRGQGGSGAVPMECASPVLIGETLGLTLRGQLVGLDAATGASRWKTPVGAEAQLYAWEHNGKAAFLAVGVQRAAKKGDPEPAVLTLVNPADGAVAWRATALFDRQYRLPVIAGDLLLAYRYGVAASNNITSGENNTLVALRLKPEGIEPAWELKGLPSVTDSYGLAVRDGHAYLSGDKAVWAIDVRTGEAVAKVEGPGGARTQVMWTAEDRVFLCPEGRHGTCMLIMLTAHGPAMKLLAAGDVAKDGWQGVWRVANPYTTAYSNHQIIHPVVDGRLFVRGADGVYCYDLRAKP